MSTFRRELYRAAWALASKTRIQEAPKLALENVSLRSSLIGAQSSSLVGGQSRWHLSTASSLMITRNFNWATPRYEEATINPLQQTPLPPSARLPQEATETISPTASTARAILRNVPISPQKLNDFARILRGLSIDDALIQCEIHHKKSARICHKVLLSAKANAVTNHGLEASKLKVEEAWVGKGQHLKRISIHGRGRSGKMYKYRSHLTILLKQEETRSRTRILPMIMERKKFWDKREEVAPDPEKRWWRWNRRHAPPPPPSAKIAAAAADEVSVQVN